MKKKRLTDKNGEVRKLTAADFRRAKPMREVLPDVAAAYRRSRGRPTGRTKEAVKLSLDADLVEAMRRTGRGWQTRANALLRQSMMLPPIHEGVRDLPRG